ncbi:hypothetical protein Tco_0157307, partial [Tanacetum coccineum]
SLIESVFDLSRDHMRWERLLCDCVCEEVFKMSMWIMSRGDVPLILLGLRFTSPCGHSNSRKNTRYLFSVDLELPSDYYKDLLCNIHEENKKLKKMGKISTTTEAGDDSKEQYQKDGGDDFYLAKREIL